MSRAGIGIELRGQDMGTLVKRVYTDRGFALHLASISNLYDRKSACSGCTGRRT